MKTTKFFIIIAFVAALVNFLVAANLYYTNGTSSGFSVGKYGRVHEGSISAKSAVIIGCTLMIVSAFFFFVYRSEKKEIQTKWKEEEKESKRYKKKRT